MKKKEGKKEFRRKERRNISNDMEKGAQNKSKKECFEKKKNTKKIEKKDNNFYLCWFI